MQLADRLCVTDIEELMDCSYEYRRDPKERAAKRSEIRGKRKMARLLAGQGTTLKVTSTTGETREFDLAEFGYT